MSNGGLLLFNQKLYMIENKESFHKIILMSHKLQFCLRLFFV